MSRHLIKLQRPDGAIEVVMGYDTRLLEFFLQVWHVEGARPRGPDDLLYDSIASPLSPWADVNTVADALACLDVEVPFSMIEAIYLDQVFNIANRIVRHYTDRPPEVLADA